MALKRNQLYAPQRRNGPMRPARENTKSSTHSSNQLQHKGGKLKKLVTLLLNARAFDAPLCRKRAVLVCTFIWISVKQDK
jgi:hypothetical protein